MAKLSLFSKILKHNDEMISLKLMSRVGKINKIDSFFAKSYVSMHTQQYIPMDRAEKK